MKKIGVSIFIFLWVASSWAAGTSDDETAAAPESATLRGAPVTESNSVETVRENPRGRTTGTKAHSILRKNFYQMSLGYHLWHEAIAVNSGGSDGKISTQFHGFKLGGSYQRPFKNIHWVEYYGADISIGSVKGTGEGLVTDELKDQPWMGITLSPGVIYRATAVSEIGFVLPLAYRKVNWKLDPTAGLETKEKSFSVGLGAIFVSRFTPYSSVMASLTHQQMWQATVWGIAWQYDFK